MKMLIASSILLSFGVYPSVSNANDEQWTRIGKDAAGSVWYAGPVRSEAVTKSTKTVFQRPPVDEAIADIKETGSYTTLWVKIDHSQDKTEKFRDTLHQYGVRCQDWSLRKMQAISYRANGSAAVSNDYTLDEKPFRNPGPSTMGEAVVTYVCGRGW